jgi:hypothetical protein
MPQHGMGCNHGDSNLYNIVSPLILDILQPNKHHFVKKIVWIWHVITKFKLEVGDVPGNPALGPLALVLCFQPHPQLQTESFKYNTMFHILTPSHMTHESYNNVENNDFILAL